ncbi:hypothetical protein FGB62_237g07 [Gracilaria domingensis]|nr:hypothetical protein FGB62_237g07 [Gracilaria domingensis]
MAPPRRWELQRRAESARRDRTSRSSTTEWGGGHDEATRSTRTGSCTATEAVSGDPSRDVPPSPTGVVCVSVRITVEVASTEDAAVEVLPARGFWRTNARSPMLRRSVTMMGSVQPE